MSHVKGPAVDHDDHFNSLSNPSTMSTKTGNSTMGPSPEIAKHWMKRYRTQIAASTSTLIATAVSHPIDTVKIQMQTGTGKSFAKSVRDMYKMGGAREFYRGFLAPLGSVTVVRTTNFSIYQRAKYFFSSIIGKTAGIEEPLATVNRPGSIPTLATLVCFGSAGALAGCMTTVIACPFELTKNTAQTSSLMARFDPARSNNTVGRFYEGKGTFRTAMEIVKQRGYVGLWSGFRLHMVRDTVGTSVYFMSYESMKQLLVKYQGQASPTAPSSVAIAGGACGIISWLTTYHIDFVKNNYQRNLLEVAKGEKVTRPRVNYFDRKQLRGLGVTMFRSSITNAVLFSSFEFIKRKIRNLPDPVN